MKIQIITIHKINNFGSVFQAYGLCEYLNRNGYNAETIDYMPSYFRKSALKSRLLGYLNYSALQSRRKKFDTFVRENIPLTKHEYLSLEELNQNPPEADVYIAGGDQLWNNHYPCGNDDAFKLTFCKGKKISFGTSLGRDNFSKEDLLSLKEKIHDFEKISVRETSSVSMLASVGLDSEWVCDPVLLLTREDYSRFVSDRPLKEKYAFVYLVPASELLDKAVRFLSEKGYKIVLCSGMRKKCYCDVFRKDLGPDEVLSYIANADFVLSASFHATLFSILFEKEFATLLPNKNTNARIEDLLTWTSLKDRIVRDELTEKILVKPNFGSANEAIQNLKKSSEIYLKQNL